MLKLEAIGNLGADAEIRVYNGNEFLSFRIAHSEKYTNKQTGEITTFTTWISCTMQGGYKGIFPYLKKGTKVFVRGAMSMKIFDSALTHQKEVGVNVSVWELELCGTKIEQKDEQSNTAEPKK